MEWSQVTDALPAYHPFVWKSNCLRCKINYNIMEWLQARCLVSAGKLGHILQVCWIGQRRCQFLTCFCIYSVYNINAQPHTIQLFYTIVYLRLLNHFFFLSRRCNLPCEHFGNLVLCLLWISWTWLSSDSHLVCTRSLSPSGVVDTHQ